MYFNENEVFLDDDDEKKATDGCVCSGTEMFYDDCVQNKTSRFRSASEKIAGALCQEQIIPP